MTTNDGNLMNDIGHARRHRYAQYCGYMARTRCKCVITDEERSQMAEILRSTGCENVDEIIERACGKMDMKR